MRKRLYEYRQWDPYHPVRARLNLNKSVFRSCLKGFVKKKPDLSEDLILELHKIMLNNIDPVEGGRYRRTNVRILGAVHLPPRAKEALDEYIRSIKQN